MRDIHLKAYATSGVRAAAITSRTPEIAQEVARMPRLVACAEANSSCGILARRTPLFGRLPSVVRSIADHVHQRVCQLLHHVAIEFRVPTDCFRLGLLARLASQIPHQTTHLLEQTTYRYHAHAHRSLLRVTGDARQLRQTMEHSPAE